MQRETIKRLTIENFTYEIIKKTEELRKHLERVKFHLLNLEVCMRLINNEKLDIKDVLTKLKEPLEMYIDALDPENDDDPESLDPEGLFSFLKQNENNYYY